MLRGCLRRVIIFVLGPAACMISTENVYVCIGKDIVLKIKSCDCYLYDDNAAFFIKNNHKS